MEAVSKLVELAERLSQGGIVLLLVTFILILTYALLLLFRAYQANTNRVITVLESSARTLEANTAVVEKATETAEANRGAIEGLTRALLERRK